MGTNTIEITEAVYDRLAAEQREDERFTDTIARLLDAETPDWRRGFGRYDGEDAEVFERVVTDSRER